MHLNKRNISIFGMIVLMTIMSNLFAQPNSKLNGEVIRYYDDSPKAIRYKGTFENGKPVGKFTYYYPNQKTKAIITHDKKTGRSEAFFYYEEGPLASHGIYKNQKKDSIWTEFSLAGYFVSQATYKDGVLHGESYIYYGKEAVEDPKIKLVLRKENYENGKLEGEYVEYFSDGVFKEKGNYTNNLRNGKIIKNHPNGRKMMEERWKMGHEHGWWKTFDENGKEIGAKYFRNGTTLEGEKLEKYLMELKEKGLNPNH